MKFEVSFNYLDTEDKTVRGYDYHPGFWGSLFGVRGAGYAGGFGANKACCHCKDCGKDWVTDYDYRTLD